LPVTHFAFVDNIPTADVLKIARLIETPANNAPM